MKSNNFFQFLSHEVYEVLEDIIIFYLHQIYSFKKNCKTL